MCDGQLSFFSPDVAFRRHRRRGVAGCLKVMIGLVGLAIIAGGSSAVEPWSVGFRGIRASNVERFEKRAES